MNCLKLIFLLYALNFIISLAGTVAEMMNDTGKTYYLNWLIINLILLAGVLLVLLALTVLVTIGVSEII